jgi:hypothetical protein
LPPPTHLFGRRLFDHLVGAGERRLRNSQTDCLGGFEIDDQLVFGRRLNWKIDSLLTLKDAIDVAGGLPILLDQIRPVGD